MSTIIIQLQGGLVQDVFVKGTGQATKAVVIDEDTEMLDGDRITEARSEDGALLEATIHTERVKPLPKGCDMERLLKEYYKNFAEVIQQK